MTIKEATQLQKDVDELVQRIWYQNSETEKQTYQRICQLTEKYGRKE